MVKIDLQARKCFAAILSRTAKGNFFSNTQTLNPFTGRFRQSFRSITMSRLSFDKSELNRKRSVCLDTKMMMRFDSDSLVQPGAHFRLRISKQESVSLCIFYDSISTNLSQTKLSVKLEIERVAPLCCDRTSLTGKKKGSVIQPLNDEWIREWNFGDHRYAIAHFLVSCRGPFSFTYH